METRLYLQILKRGWWIIAMTVLAALNTSLLISYLTKPVYEAKSRFVVSPNAGAYQTSYDITSSMDTLDRRSIINTYKELLVSSTVYNNHPDIVKIPAEEFSKEYTISAVVIPDTNILELTVDGSDPQKITTIAKAIGESALTYINKLYPVYNFAILVPPSVPTNPIRPKPIQNAGFALIIGIILGAGLALLRDQLQNSLDALRARSAIDNVTTAYTRNYFERLLNQQVINKPDEVLSLGLINFRGLEEVADVLPPSIFNKVLRQEAQTLIEELRSNDVVGKWDKTQLSVLLPSTPGTAAENTMKRIQNLLARPISLDGISDTVLHPDPRIGIIEKKPGESDGEALIEYAENAMLKASVMNGASVMLVRKNGNHHEAAEAKPKK
ncbi:MAG: diguanylate cyclase [Chloroflexi bacterium]|nr:diguanylate cyclase [Chloroflexota bacterium]